MPAMCMQPPHPLHFVVALSSIMPRYAFIVKALSLRDAGGLVRMAGYWQTEEDGWQFDCQFFTLLVLSGVERTIVF